MPREYKRKTGSRAYLTGYTDEDLQKALADIKSGQKSIRKASDVYKIPYGTLNYKSKNIEKKKPGDRALVSCEDTKFPNRSIDLKIK